MIRVIRFGSKSLSRWQRTYGPTKLELLGMVTAILDFSVYLRGRRFIVECDHQALKPLFQKQLKGTIYERWIAILQQYNFDLRYKPARDMQVADALSRIPRQEISDGFISPDIEDPYFPYKEEIVGDINIEGGYKFPSFKHSDSSENDQINNIRVDQNLTSNFNLLSPDHQHKPDLQTTAEYDADTEDDVPGKQNKLKRKIVSKRKLLSIPHLRINPSENNPVSVNNTDIESVSDNDMKQNIEIQNPTNTVDTDISVPSTDRSSDDQSTVLNEHDSDIFNLTTDVNTDQDNQMRRQVEMIDLFERSDFSVESLSNLQRKDSDYGKFVSYFDKGELPKSQKEARKLLLQSPDFMLINGLLFHSRIAKSKRARNLSSCSENRYFYVS
ncbi:unnamed protein product [Mytilus coruscus]|uniref:Reverse transcriptase RNase H-like domain-containing protein n=1 Tax=Mytilus coruscus TaxID=42192 RepID=A0A6J8BYY4_MYTCO|nr:unnamed protein product [Mytilus coruscus]